MIQYVSVSNPITNVRTREIKFIKDPIIQYYYIKHLPVFLLDITTSEGYWC
jgi:hypothetical protein